MKKVIEDNYLIKIEELKETNDYCYFLRGGDYYYFVRSIYSENEILRIIQLLSSSSILNKLSHKVMINIHGRYITNEFVLLRVKGVINEDLGVEELVKFNYVLKGSSSDIIVWSKLWEQRIDYYEYQIREIGKDKRLILSTFSYYSGMAEVACSYANKVGQMIKIGPFDRQVVSHRRVLWPNYKINFFNPLVYTIDLEVRDIASYIKSKFWAGEEVWQDLDYYFQNKKFGEYSYHMFYARMLYPSYYFDMYEKIIHNQMDEDALIPFINKMESYEVFLKDLKRYLSKYVRLFDIPWLN